MGNKLQKIRDWYTKEYPDDELGAEISENVTFKDLFGALDTYKDVYEILGVGDSLIRERAFDRLANIMGGDYDYIYNQWLLCN